jgi:hypothetical protein
MGGMIRKSFDSPEETRPFEDGTGELQRTVNLRGALHPIFVRWV